MEELMEELKEDSDEDQGMVLKKLEDEYNAAHRSNILVTGTLSIVANEPLRKHRFTNSSYF